MQLQELLDHVNSEVLQDRPAVVSGPNKNLWNDATLVRYFNQAEQMFARRTYCLIDDTTASTCTIDMVASTAAYNLHASVLRVLDVRMADTETPLQRSTKAQVLASVAHQISDGRPLVWTTDTATRKIYVYPPPDATNAAIDLKLRVVRMPITPLSLTALTAEPEIPEEFHLDLCDWVVYKALIHREVDGVSVKDAEIYRAAFLRAIAAARLDTKRLYHPDGEFLFGGWGNG